MQVAVIADVHANLEALDAVLRDIDRRAPAARVVCAGDIVGYGPDPEACLDRLLARDALMVRGNHEEMALGWRDNSQCVHAGILAVAWTRARLSLRAMTLLAGLPAVADVGDGIVMCHGDLDDAGTYVSDRSRALHSLERLQLRYPGARMLVCGHTHRAMFFSSVRGALPVKDGVDVAFADDKLCLLNPGAVGQSRNDDPLASWALVDVDRGVVSFSTLGYDHPKTIEKLRRAGLVARVVLPQPVGVARQVESTKAKAARIWVEAQPLIAKVLRRHTINSETAGAGAPEFEPPKLGRRALAVAQRALHKSGGSGAFLRVRAVRGDDGGALILAYHSVTSNEQVPFVDPRFSVPLPIFERQMSFLAARRNVLSMSELVDRVQRRTRIPTGSVVITFDDGYLDTLQVAAPVLDRLGLPALVYLPTGQIARAQSQFIDVLYGAFTLRTRHSLQVPQAGVSAVLRDRDFVQRTYLTMGDRLSRMSLAERTEVLAVVVEQLRPSRVLPRLTMSWDDVLELRARHPRFDIGVHTRDHVDLTTCDDALLRDELSSCITDLRAATGHTAEHFAYPYGRSSMRVRDDVSILPLRSAAVTEPADLVLHGADVFNLPRLLAPSSMELFPFFTSGAYPGVSQAVLRRS